MESDPFAYPYKTKEEAEHWGKLFAYKLWCKTVDCLRNVVRSSVLLWVRLLIWSRWWFFLGNRCAYEEAAGTFLDWHYWELHLWRVSRIKWSAHSYVVVIWIREPLIKATPESGPLSIRSQINVIYDHLLSFFRPKSELLLPWTPIIDNAYLHGQPLEILASGNASYHVPMIVVSESKAAIVTMS